ncbi:MAG: type II secretion system protein [Desulfobacterales bacterium]|nr:type II secretion system protein [Desulfobacterales bacterium]
MKLDIDWVDKNNSGFTLVEVIAVLVVIGIVAAFAVSSALLFLSSYKLATEDAILRMHLRYVQYRALSDDLSWGMSFTGSSYTSLRNGNTSPYNLPNEAGATHTLASGVSFSPTPGNVIFDKWGSPGANNVTITLSSGGEFKTVTITRNTGFIP